MRIFDKDIKLAIFDLDGTLIDSTSIWAEIDEKFFHKHGLEIPPSYNEEIAHIGLTKAAELTRELYRIQESPEEIILEWRQMAIDLYQNDVQLKEGAIELLELFKKNGLKLSIATANDEELYMPCVKRLGIGKYFDFIADVNSSKEGKNSAKIYLDLAKDMASKPENTLVLEDMPTCIKTVHDAGFPTIAVYDKASEKFDNEKRSNSDLFINNFNELIDLLK